MARPTSFTKETLQKLEEAFAMDCTDEEACFYANIAPASLYNYQKQNKGFLERKQALKQNPVLKARMEVIKGMKGNPALALKYLERKRSQEFQPNNMARIEASTLNLMQTMEITYVVPTE
jgi:Na+-translocating ferredoxin:NAD+ oxidoreductase RnfC subunit